MVVDTLEELMYKRIFQQFREIGENRARIAKRQINQFRLA